MAALGGSCAGSAAAAGRRRGGLRFSPRVEQVLDHLAAHPMRLQSIAMLYEPSGSLSTAHLPPVIQVRASAS